MPITFEDTDDLYLDKRQCAVCGKPTYRLGLESGDQDRGEKEPLICNECLISIRRDMATEFGLRQKVSSLETRAVCVSYELHARLCAWVLTRRILGCRCWTPWIVASPEEK